MHIPLSTYRLQFNPGFTFNDASFFLDYAAELGISALYASPIFKARKGSMHGYDIVNPLELNPDLGTPADFGRLCEGVKSRGMFWLQDIVPNHMAFDKENTLLMDILHNGQHSPYIDFFDIDWKHYYESLNGRLLAPFLGTFYAEALHNCHIQLVFRERGIFIRYFEHVFPIKVESYAAIFEHVLRELQQSLGTQDPVFTGFLGALELFKSALDIGEVHSRSNQVEHAFKMVWGLYEQEKQIAEALNRTLRSLNGTKNDAHSFDALDTLISQQLFRLSFWKVAAEEINYRRFFAINDLICLRVEEESVFNFTHDFIIRLIDEGKFDGLRIDHIDGLSDPGEYLKRLRDRAPDTFIVVEKILQTHERGVREWPVQGTTGYDFMNQVNRLFCDSTKAKEFTRIYAKFSGLRVDYETLVCEKKRLIIGKHLAGNIDNLAQQLKRISNNDRYGRDITLYGLRRALVEALASLPVYRTYIAQDRLRPEDKSVVEEAFRRARRNIPDFTYELDYIEKFLLLQYRQGLSEEEKKQWVAFVSAFQQYTAPLMAKGFEDTILYVYNRLTSLNEVGGAPELFGGSADDFHAFNADKVSRQDFSLNATSTHDTKRGEDLRARINVLSEIPEEWDDFLNTVSRLSRCGKTIINDHAFPDENDEYFLYQTLLGAFPFEETDLPRFLKRMEAYVVKAVREAKVHTAWIRPDSDYEAACISFLRSLVADTPDNKFLPVFRRLQKKVAFFGVFNSLSQLMLKACCAGVPDFYQGCELWDLHLVDPDNRQPVDFSKLSSLLRELKSSMKKHDASFVKELLQQRKDGRIKLFLTHRLLSLRKEYPGVFQRGSYLPLEVRGSFKDNVVAFAREHEGVWLVCCVGRFFTRLVREGEFPAGDEVWKDTEIILPAHLPVSWYDEMTDRILTAQGSLKAGSVFDTLACAALIAKTAG